MFVHHAQRAVALFGPVLDRVKLQFPAALHEREPEPCGAKIWFERMLFEEHPLQRLGAIDASSETRSEPAAMYHRIALNSGR